jgi:hypothetical protein
MIHPIHNPVTYDQIHREAFDRLVETMNKGERLSMKNLGNFMLKNPGARSYELALKEINHGRHTCNAHFALKLLNVAGLAVHTNHGPQGVSIKVLWAPLAERLAGL